MSIYDMCHLRFGKVKDLSARAFCSTVQCPIFARVFIIDALSFPRRRKPKTAMQSNFVGCDGSHRQKGRNQLYIYIYTCLLIYRIAKTNKGEKPREHVCLHATFRTRKRKFLCDDSANRC